jgi:signal transduction histidine kinase
MGDTGRRRRNASGAGTERSEGAGLQREASQLIMSASPDGIVAVDEHGIIRLANPAAAELFARPTSELVGSPFGFPITVDEPSEIDVVHRDGRTHVVEMRVTATTWEGQTFHVVGLRDVTRRRHAERELQTALEQQNVVLSIAAHDLHAPLAAIGVLAHLLRTRRGTLTEEQTGEFLERIAERTDRLQGLIRQLLTASLIDSEDTGGAPEPVLAYEFILERLGEFHERVQDVRVSCSPELVAFVDRREFAIMLDNYLDNAVNHGRPPIEVEAIGRADRVEIRVRDAGPGVPDAFVPQLFHRGSRAPHGDRDTEGSGLGVWITRHLAQANGGDAWYEPSEGAGACFGLYLPSTPPP